MAKPVTPPPIETNVAPGPDAGNVVPPPPEKTVTPVAPARGTPDNRPISGAVSGPVIRRGGKRAPWSVQIKQRVQDRLEDWHKTLLTQYRGLTYGQFIEIVLREGYKNEQAILEAVDKLYQDDDEL